MTAFEGTVGELFASCERTAVHLEMRDVYSTDDPVFQDWRVHRSRDAQALLRRVRGGLGRATPHADHRPA